MRVPLLRFPAVLCAALMLASGLMACTDLREDVVEIPVVVDASGKSVELTATLFRPAGAGPFPLLVLNHGITLDSDDRHKIGRYRKLKQIDEFVKRGFAVVVPIRRGFGDTGGEFAEAFGGCKTANFYEAGLEAAKDVVATVEYAQKLPYVNRERVLLVGHSEGGYASLAAASRNPPGLVGVVNFAGGRGGNSKVRPGEPCQPERLAEAIGRYARTTKVPVLWYYAENDQYFPPAQVRAWFRAFKNAGGRGRLYLGAPFGKDGHNLFTSDQGLTVWTLEFDKFLAELGLAAHIAALTPASPPR